MSRYVSTVLLNYSHFQKKGLTNASIYNFRIIGGFSTTSIFGNNRVNRERVVAQNKGEAIRVQN